MAAGEPWPRDAVGRATRVTLDITALRHNLGAARRAAPGARIMAAIKANGYGHGLARVATALADADAFGVACINEALTLRQAGVRQPICLLEGFFRTEELPLVAENAFEIVVHHPFQVTALESMDVPVRVWLKVDSGMHRLGFPPPALREAWERLEALPRVQIAGFMTHLANADDRRDSATEAQLRCFAAAVAGLPGERAIANSAGVLGWPVTHADWVRPGIMLYGVSPFLGGSGLDWGLRPVMTFHSELIAVNRLDEGEAVGYGGTWRAPEAMTVGVVAAGYGDGYPRHAPSGTPVLVRGRRVPLVGRVSMDMITVDLRELPDARVGDPVVLWGAGLPVEDIACRAGTIAYELLCGITQRVSTVELP